MAFVLPSLFYGTTHALDCCAPDAVDPGVHLASDIQVSWPQVAGVWVEKTAPASIGVVMITCQECGKPAMYQLSNGALICLECVDRFQIEQTAAIIKFLLGEMECVTEIPRGSLKPRIGTPKVASHRQPTTVTNIRLDRSVVGVINTGQAQAIDVALSYVKQNGNPGLSKLLQEFTQGILDNRELDQALRKAIIEQLSFLLSQTLAKPEQKRPSIVKAVLKSIKETLSTFSGLVALWETLEPYLREVLR